MAGNQRTADKQSSAPPHRKLRHKRAETRITATPLARTTPLPRRPVSRAREKPKEPIIKSPTDDDDWWSLPLPTSPANSPVRPLDICTPSKCTVDADLNATQTYAYRPLYDENNKTLRDALGRQVSGRHRIAGKEVTRDRSYLRLTRKAMVDHGIATWPLPPFDYDDPHERDRCLEEYHKNDQNMVDYETPDTPAAKDPAMVVHSTARKQPASRQPRRLFLDESGAGEEGLDDEDEDVFTLEKEKETSLEETAIAHSKRSVSSATKQRSSKKPEGKGRKSSRLISIGSVNSTGLKMKLVSDGMEDDKDEEEEQVTEDVAIEDNLMAGDHSEAVGMDKETVEEENQAVVGKTPRPRSRGETEARSSSSRKRRASKKSSLQRSVSSSRRRLFDESFKSNGVRRMEESMGDVEVIDATNEMNEEMHHRVEETNHESGDGEGGLEENEMEGDNVVGLDRSSEEDDEEEMEDEEENEDEEEEEEEEESMEKRKESSGSEGTLQEEMDENNEDEEFADGIEENGEALFDVTLPLNQVVSSIGNPQLRRLLAVCKQDDISSMDEFFTGINWGVKVGEGSYAEVFLVKRDWNTEKRVFKILKMDEDVDCKMFLGEIVVSKELTRLRKGRCAIASFAQMYSAKILQGKFPPLLETAWNDFYNSHGEDEAQNDENPAEWGEEQKFVCIECEYGGLNLKKFPFSSVQEIISVYCQTALALTVAESEVEFEHRDLHEENVLVKRTDEESLQFIYYGADGGPPTCTPVPTHGVKSTIIDFTLSRLTKKETVINHELGDDICEQTAKAEQYQVYRKMKKLTKGKWNAFTPKSNALWLRMQLNWIIKENLNPSSALNKARVKASKEARSRRSQMTRRTTISKINKSSVAHSEGEETEISGEAWLKKLKEGKKVIAILKNFVDDFTSFESAEDVVESDGFKNLLSLLEEK